MGYQKKNKVRIKDVLNLNLDATKYPLATIRAGKAIALTNPTVFATDSSLRNFGSTLYSKSNIKIEYIPIAINAAGRTPIQRMISSLVI